MGIISLSKDMVVDYAPEYGGNRSSEDDNKTIIGISPMTHQDIQAITRQLATKLKGTKADTESMAEVSQVVQKKQFLKYVKHIKNYSIDEGVGDLRTLEEKDVAGFYEAADDELIGEIIRAMESHTKLTEGQVKN